MKDKVKKVRQKSTFWKDFKSFISRGNIVDLAVGVIIGAAFTAIVNSLVNDIIKPLIALLLNGDFSELVVVLRPEVIDASGAIVKQAIRLNYGNLIMAVLTFLIDALVIFTALRIVRRAGKKLREATEEFKEKFSKDDEKESETEEKEIVVQETVSETVAETVDLQPFSSATEELLKEIRDLLKGKNLSDADQAEQDAADQKKN